MAQKGNFPKITKVKVAEPSITDRVISWGLSPDSDWWSDVVSLAQNLVVSADHFNGCTVFAQLLPVA